jgi:hypothetical protein
LAGNFFGHDWFAQFGVYRPRERAVWTPRQLNDADGTPVTVENARFRKSDEKDLQNMQVVADVQYVTVSLWGSKDDFDPKPDDAITRSATGEVFRVRKAAWKVSDNLCVCVAALEVD